MSYRQAAWVVVLPLLSGCLGFRLQRHPHHPTAAERGRAFVEGAPPQPLLTAPLHAVILSDDDGSNPAQLGTHELAWMTEFANQVFAPAGVRFEIDPQRDTTRLKSTALNRIDEGAPDFLAVAAAAEEVARGFPGRIVVLFHHGGGKRGNGRGFSSQDLGFVSMPGWGEMSHCGHQHTKLFAHELGHFLGLAHTFSRTFETDRAAEEFLAANGGTAACFDGDGLADTPPDPAVARTECNAEAELWFEGARVPLARRNVMSYYDEADSLTAGQVELVRWMLTTLEAHGMLPLRNTARSKPIEAEAAPMLTNATCGLQSMGVFGRHWSGGAQLHCAPLREGSPIEVRLPLEVPARGAYQLTAYLTRSPHFGVVEASLGGRPAGEPFDGWAPFVLPSGAISLGVHVLEEGSHQLVLRVERKAPQSLGLSLGVDAIELVPADAAPVQQ